MTDQIKCPKCGSTQITANKKGFGLGKAVLGGLATGGIGLLAGFIGSGNIRITCLACGHSFTPTEANQQRRQKANAELQKKIAKANAEIQEERNGEAGLTDKLDEHGNVVDMRHEHCTFGFWKYKPNVQMDDVSVFKKLSKGREDEDIEALPVDKIIEKITASFPDWEKTDDMRWKGATGEFEIFSTPQFICVDCWDMWGHEMNRIINVGHDFGCPLYDHEQKQRYGEG